MNQETELVKEAISSDDYATFMGAFTGTALGRLRLKGFQDKFLQAFVNLRNALRHAEHRLNDIPHSYKDTNWELIRDALLMADSFLDQEDKPK